MVPREPRDIRQDGLFELLDIEAMACETCLATSLAQLQE